jgi:hypothetical protein
VSNILDKPIALGTTRILLVTLKDDLFEFTIRLEDLLEIGLGDTKVDVANVEAVEGRAVGARNSTALGGSSSAVLLGFGKLRDDRDALQSLTSQLESFGDRLLLLELNVTDAGIGSANIILDRWTTRLPFGTTGDSILNDLGLDDFADSLEEAAQMAGLSALRNLLHKDSALVAIIFGDLGLGCLLAVADTALAAIATVARPVAAALMVPVFTVTAGRAGAGTATSAVVVTSVSTISAISTASTTSAVSAVASAVAIARAAAPVPITIPFICVSSARSRTAPISPPIVPVSTPTAVSIRLTIAAPVTAL